MKLSDVSASLKKEHGDSFVTKASEVNDVERLPTSIYPFDFATGGGFPRGNVSIIWGAESSGKTNLALKAIAMNQMIEPEKTNLFMDLEGGFNPKWAKMLGVDCSDSKLAVMKPAHGEQAVDIIHKAIEADDIGCIVFDSVGAMVTINEEESEAAKAAVGGAALLITKMMKKITVGLTIAARNNRFPPIIMINQMRSKIGVMYGSPDTMPGGIKLRHSSALTVKVRGKDITEGSINKNKPAYKEMKGSIVKAKVPTLFNDFEFKFPVINQGGLKVGFIDDWNTIYAQLKELGWMYKDTKTVHCLGETYPTYKAVREELYNDPELITEVRARIMEAYLNDIYGLDSEDDET